MKIAVIGGIGSGKSSVLSYLTQLGERTCDCDEIYREITHDPTYIRLVGEMFGVVKGDTIDKKALGEIVFADEEQRQKLNAIAHPLVFQRLEEIYAESESNLFVEVSAFDENMADKFDIIVYVKSSISNRIERVKRRNNFEENYIQSIMSGQMPPEQMEEIADFILINDADTQELHRQVEWIVQWIGLE